MRRRTYIALTGALTAGLAGCLGSDSDDEPGTNDDSETGDEPETDDGGPGTDEPESEDEESEDEESEADDDSDEGEAEAIGSDWPRPAYDAGRTRYNPDEAWIGDLEPVWTHSFEYASSHFVRDGVVYVNRDRNGIVAIDADGEIRWVQDLHVIGDITVVDGEIVARNDNERLFRFDADTGDRLDAADPEFEGSIVYLGPEGIYTVADGESIGEYVLRKYDVQSTETEWERTLELSTWNSDILFSGDTLVLSNRFETYGVDDATGDVLWESEYGSQSDRHFAARGGRIVLYNDPDDTLCVLDADGELEWVTEEMDRIRGSIAIDDDAIYYGEGDIMYAVDVTSGETLWDYIGTEDIQQTIVTSDTVYTVENDQTSGGTLLALDKANGDRRFEDADADCAGIVAANDAVYIRTRPSITSRGVAALHPVAEEDDV
ncbi:PQQ-like beta-propeller repeat protein [Halobacteria archaeon AArc-dxtr1]|nr:PQQ-like beta-propeller repeat protein [Halobacteria archaeon AArc-dxtr1]